MHGRLLRPITIISICAILFQCCNVWEFSHAKKVLSPAGHKHKQCPKSDFSECPSFENPLTLGAEESSYILFRAAHASGATVWCFSSTQPGFGCALFSNQHGRPPDSLTCQVHLLLCHQFPVLISEVAMRLDDN